MGFLVTILVYVYASFWVLCAVVTVSLSLVLFVACLGDTKVLAAVYGPKAGTRKNENPEKACIEVIWKPKTGQSGNFSTHVIHLYLLLHAEICIPVVNFQHAITTFVF